MLKNDCLRLHKGARRVEFCTRRKVLIGQKIYP